MAEQFSENSLGIHLFLFEDDLGVQKLDAPLESAIGHFP